MEKRQNLNLSTDQRPFIMIYQDFLESNVLGSMNEKMLFIALKKFANSKNQCFPSLQKLSDISGMSKKSVQRYLKVLEEKKVISVKHQKRDDGGRSSNLYTLYDFKELWEVDKTEDIPRAIDAFEEQKMIDALEKKGYTVTKEKEPASNTGQSMEASACLKSYCCNNNKADFEKSQEGERYSYFQIEEFFAYEAMVNDHPDMVKDIDSVMNILYIEMNSTKPTIRISGEELPTMVVVAKLMKLTNEGILYAIRKFNEQTGRIQNPTAYMLTLLYKAEEQYHLEIKNRVNYNMAHPDQDDQQGS